MNIVHRLSSDISSSMKFRTNANYVGLDLSLTSTGLVFLTGDGVVESYTISTSPKDGCDTSRIAYIRDSIWSIITSICEIENQPTLVAVEGYAMGIRGGKVFTLGELGGVVKESLRQNNKNSLIVPPMVLKKFIGASGSGKECVKLELYKKYSIEFKTSDETDALVLALMALHYDHINNKGTISAYQKDSLDRCVHLNFNKKIRPKIS